MLSKGKKPALVIQRNLIMNRQPKLLRQIRFLTALFIIGLILSGATAIPLQSEIDWLVKVIEHRSPGLSAMERWLARVQTALHDVSTGHAFLFYGTDWLAFGHFMIALAFVGALRDPIRNRWLFDFGLIACVVLVPYAFVFGAIRGIPFWWRLIDCSFGVFACIPLWMCRRWSAELERHRRRRVSVSEAENLQGA